MTPELRLVKWESNTGATAVTQSSLQTTCNPGFALWVGDVLGSGCATHFQNFLRRLLVGICGCVLNYLAFENTAQHLMAALWKTVVTKKKKEEKKHLQASPK